MNQYFGLCMRGTERPEEGFIAWPLGRLLAVAFLPSSFLGQMLRDHATIDGPLRVGRAKNELC